MYLYFRVFNIEIFEMIPLHTFDIITHLFLFLLHLPNVAKTHPVLHFWGVNLPRPGRVFDFRILFLLKPGL